jgi:hypothetical protein
MLFHILPCVQLRYLIEREHFQIKTSEVARNIINGFIRVCSVPSPILHGILEIGVPAIIETERLLKVFAEKFYVK